jgi:squalene-hopene/tetraprenyl-beta-curcumene cyclase
MLRHAVWFGLIASALPCRGEGATVDESLAKAVAYLWRQQGEDGGWHSPQYGVLKSGQALTPFVLHAQLQALGDMSGDEAGGVVRAAQFIARHIDKHGALGRSDAELTEYPVYSTAFGVLALGRVQGYHHILGPDADRDVHRMREYLVSAQYDAGEGLKPSDAAFGGWGFQEVLRPGKLGHMDLAHTRYALQALGPYVYAKRTPEHVGDNAEHFLRVVQKHPDAVAQQPAANSKAHHGPTPFDGGFYFSPVVLTANKGRVEEEPAPHWRSYATATCDGILALLAAGVPPEEPRVAAAVSWLERHTDVDYPQGVPTEHPEPWGEAIRFYHYSVRAEVYRKLKFPAEQRAKLAAAVVKHQRADGSFVNNVSPLMKEDDPVLCTALAVVALANCVQ